MSVSLFALAETEGREREQLQQAVKGQLRHKAACSLQMQPVRCM